VATQGRDASFLQCVSKYKLQYSNDGQTFTDYKEEGETDAKILTGNSDQNTVVKHELSQPITARYIRLVPLSWKGHISMRMELYGCEKSSSSSNACDSNPCQNDGTCEDIGNGNYKCECPGVYGGDNCEKGKTSKVFVFGGLPV